MASEATTTSYGGSGGIGALGPRKILPSSNIETPPSPPATETDTEETDSETSPARHGTSQSDGNDRNISTPVAAADADAPVISPVTSPPYWYQSHPTHARSASRASEESFAGAIILRDNENSSIDERNHACWAKSVDITDHVVVNGSATNIGAFVVWNIRVETLSGSYLNIRKRYSEFDDLRWRLVRTFPNFEAAVPELPPKSLISKFRPRFLEKRRAGLQYFLNCIMLNPEFSGSPVLKEFLFS